MGVSPDTATGAKDFSASMKFSFSLLNKLSKSLSKNTIRMGKWGFPLPETHEFCFYKGGSFYPNGLFSRRTCQYASSAESVGE